MLDRGCNQNQNFYASQNSGSDSEQRIDDYFAYMLRLRRVDNAGDTEWVITLEEPGTDREYRFADLIALIRFLHETMGQAAPPTVFHLRNQPSPPNCE